jgi:PAS domain S-box-containing protein
LRNVNLGLHTRSRIGSIARQVRERMSQDKHNSAVLHAILEAAVDAIIVSDENGLMLRANPMACRLFNYELDELIGKNVNLLMPQSLANQHDGFMHHHVTTGEKRIIGIGRDIEGQRKNGSIFPVHLSVGEAEVDNQKIFIAILHDLTRRHAAKDALARSQRLDAIGQMTGGIAHDFRNLLTVVIGNLELLEMRGASDRQLLLIHDALDAAQLGADLTGRLMAFARQSNLKPREADLGTLCDGTLAILNRTLGSQINITTRCPSGLKPIMIDPVQLRSAIVNLALNARDAMGVQGELLISVENVSIDDSYMSMETDMPPGDYVRLSISDNGAGMTPETQQRAFEPFYTTKSNAGGTGLGLATVYGFVRQSGGYITLYSEPGLGTSFGLYFPALHADQKTAQPATGWISQSPPEPVSGKTVLVVEDNPKVRKLSVERLKDLGFVTKEAANGDAAYRLLKTGFVPDIVFSDLVMPGDLNGYDLAAKVAAEFPDVLILLTSGYASDTITGSMAHERPYEILHKPYRQRELARRLQALLGGIRDDATD